MITVAAPLWLLGLALGPLIWWLHRASGHGRPVPVPSLLLFRDAAAPRTGGERAPRADPAWWRRAGIAVLLALALAGPVLERPAREVTVWLDDSPSMGTREPGGTRMALAMAALREALPAAGRDQVLLRSLTTPGAVYTLDGPLPAIRRREAHAPPPVALRPATAHWLITDGSNPGLEDWARSGALDRVIHVGRETENAGLVALAVRARLEDAARLDGEVRVRNAGLHAARRQLTVRTGATLLLDVALDLAAGESRTLAFSLPRPGGDQAPALEAKLSPADALPEDDQLALPAALLRTRRVSLAPGCPRALRNALRANPDLLPVAADAAADVAIDCGGTASATRSPRLVLRTARDAPEVPVRDPTWRAAAREALSETALPRTLRARGELRSGDAGDLPLLEADGRVLVIARTGTPRRVETTLDLAAAATASAPEYPLLVGELLELASGEPLLARIARSARDPQTLTIAPGSEAGAAAASVHGRAHHSPAAWRLAPALFALAALLLLWDFAAALWVALRQARATAHAEASA